jgi:hypothetical protein
MSRTATIARTDDALLGFADAIVAFTNAGGSIEELRATIAAESAPKPVKTTVKAATIAPKRAHKAKGNEDWKSGKPSVKQLDRMNRLETALNRHYGEDCALSVAADFANAGALSDEYRALAAEGSKLGLNWAA